MHTTDVLVPTSRDEAVQAFGDGRGVTVFGGGTILMPEVTAGKLRPARALFLAKAGLAGVSRENGSLKIGAMTPIAALADTFEPLTSAATHFADYEVRGQATLGGNLCAAAGEMLRGDYQAVLLATGARVRSAGAGGERTDSIDDFLAAPDGRLVLEVEVDEPKRSSTAMLRRPHAHPYTILTVFTAEGADGVRVAAIGAGASPMRLQSVEAAVREGADPKTAAARATDDAGPPDDALASAWYRQKMLPVLVERALSEL